MPVYDLQSLGVVNDGNPANAARNTAVCQKAFQDARGGNPGPIELGMGAGMAVLNGQLSLDGANMVFRGLGGMGTVSDWAPTSLVRGFGPGHTLKVPQGGCQVSGLCWQGDGQTGGDAFIYVSGTQVALSNLYMDGPWIGISMYLPWMAGGQFWIENVLMGGQIKFAGIIGSPGNAAVRLNHVRMFSGDMLPATPQPKYGVLLTSCGELLMGDCDICNCGSNLALKPGLTLPGASAISNQNIGAVMVKRCLFDNGNGLGNVLLQPEGSGYMADLEFQAWTSTVNNGEGRWNTNGFTIDGTKAAGVIARPIQNVRLRGCWGRNHVNHCGVWATKVHGQPGPCPKPRAGRLQHLLPARGLPASMPAPGRGGSPAESTADLRCNDVQRWIF